MHMHDAALLFHGLDNRTPDPLLLQAADQIHRIDQLPPVGVDEDAAAKAAEVPDQPLSALLSIP